MFDTTATATATAYAAGKSAANEMLQPGNVFQGSFNVADSLGYARESHEWRAAVFGAAFAIAQYGDILTDNDGKLAAPTVKIKLHGRIGGWQ